MFQPRSQPGSGLPAPAPLPPPSPVGEGGEGGDCGASDTGRDPHAPATQASASPVVPVVGGEAERLLLRLQLRTFALTWLSYASYYLTRKNLSVTKSRLHDGLGVSTTELGIIDTAYLASYALGQFINGALGDRIGSRRLIALGMLGSAAMALGFGLSSSVPLFLLCFALNGAMQSTGWPGNVKAMQPFFPSGTRGRVMGLWTTNYQAGGLIATALATFLLVRLGWRAAFIGPALWVASIGVLIRLFLVERPEERGLPPVEPEPRLAPGTASAPAATTSPPGPTLGRLLRLPVLWTLGTAYFGIKLIRYSLLFWLPFYLKQHLHYSEGAAGYLSLPFELGGIIGSIGVGWLSDRYFRTRRLWLTSPLLLLLGGGLLLYQRVGGAGVLVNVALLALVGFLLFGPDSLLSGTTAQDLGGRHATARVAGIINGMGSVGAIFSPMLVARVTERLGWDALFLGFCGLTVLSSLLLAASAALVPAARRALASA